MNGSRRRGLLLLPPLGATLAALASGCSHPTGSAPAPVQAAAASPQSAAASFETVKAVLQSPRCVNCHPVGDAPLQGDDSHVHLQNIQRGDHGSGVAGLSCAACHGRANPPASYGSHAPPGVSTEWRLPPADTKMIFQGLGARALCEQLKDPQRNGGKDMAHLIEHVSGDPLVLWGWSPGHGRKPVPIAHADFVAAFKAWAQAGAPCPTR
ncbi:MAG TPA: Isoquinoline 1-oxidoreductase subunit [Anaeromyxobacteraceae bacterium]|nr:Isoquinoline 1-oxidoreductase subunit [Anaeromyxobacteraceae bacterium]